MRRPSVALALRAYAWCLRLLPSALLRAYGDEMRLAFEQRVLAAHASRGARGVLATALGAGVDVIVSAVASWRTTAARNPERAAVLVSDLHLGFRNLLRRPAFSSVAALTLALGIGANVAMFAIVQSVLLRPLPFPDADRIVWIGHHAPGMGMPDLASSTGTYAVYREHARSFSAVAAHRNAQRNVAGGPNPERIDVATVTPSIFNVLQVRPLLGRPFIDADAQPGAPPVAILTQAGLRAHFGGSSDVIGRTIELDGIQTEVVGIMPEGFAYPRPSTRMLLPSTSETPVFASFGLTTIARLGNGVDVAAARAELTVLQSRHQEVYSIPAHVFSDMGWSVSLRRLQDVAVGSVGPLLWVSMATVGFLLLVACASVANMFLVRGESRRIEFGVRRALGATRARIASALLAESAWIGIVGGLVGVALAWSALRLVVASGSGHLPRLHEIRLDLAVLVVAVSLSVVTGVLLGLLPLLQQPRDGSFSIARVGRGDIGGRDRQRVRRGLIVAQLALALVLLTGSGLMLRSFGALQAVDHGLDPEGALVVGISAGAARAAGPANARYLEMLEATRAIAGVRVVGLTTALPLGGGSMTASNVTVESRTQVQQELPEVVWYEGVSDGYFAATGTGVVAGRELTREDVAFGRPVALVNERFAATVLNGDALGRRLRIGGDSTAYEIVGVVRDVRAFDLREDTRPMAYAPFTSSLFPARIQSVYLVLRSDGPPENLAQSTRAAIRTVDPNAPVLYARTLQYVLDDALADLTFTSAVLSVAAALALLLGAIGLYGVISYAVSERRSEIGVRVALGASPAAVSRLVLREGISLAVLGAALGLAGAILLTRFLRAVLFEVSARDPLTFAGVAFILLAVTLIAAWLPARRAARIDPLDAMHGTG
jgi:predicted permease